MKKIFAKKCIQNRKCFTKKNLELFDFKKKVIEIVPDFFSPKIQTI